MQSFWFTEFLTSSAGFSKFDDVDKLVFGKEFLPIKEKNDCADFFFYKSTKLLSTGRMTKNQ